MDIFPAEAEVFDGILFGCDFGSHTSDGCAEEEIDEGVSISAKGLHARKIFGSLAALNNKNRKVVAK